MAAFGEATNLIAGAMILTLPPPAKYWFLQCRDLAFLDVKFIGVTNGVCSPIGLDTALVAGGAGDWLDSFKFPFAFISVLITSSVTTAQFASGWSGTSPDQSQAQALASFLDSGRR
jgi:hypothetical protein